MNEEQFEKFKNNVLNMPDEMFVEFIPKTMLEISQDGLKTGQFIFWLIYDTEMRLKELVRDIMTKERKGLDEEEIKVFVEDVFEELTLMGKINLIEKNLKREGSGKRFKKLCSILREFNNIRNTLFHQKIKIEDITYNGKKISDPSIKKQMVIDLVDGFTAQP